MPVSLHIHGRVNLSNCLIHTRVALVHPTCLQCAHIMAMAVQRLHKNAQVTIGPWIDRGFYYDFDLPTPLSDKDLKAIKKEMQKIIRMNLPFIREEVSSRWTDEAVCNTAAGAGRKFWSGNRVIDTFVSLGHDHA